MISVEIDERDLYELLSFAKEGIQKAWDYSPNLAHAYKELASKLPEIGYDYVKNFANSLFDAEEDYSFLIDDYDDDDYY